MSNMLSVWKDGEHWFDFPQVNELNVQGMLQRKGVSASCVILPQGMEPRTGKVTVVAPQIVKVKDDGNQDGNNKAKPRRSPKSK